MPDVERDLERARHLAFAADEEAAKDLLLSLMPAIEQADRDDLMLEVYAQLGEIYLVRTAYDGVDGMSEPHARLPGRLLADPRGTRPDGRSGDDVDAEIDHMICRYTRRAQFLQTGLAAAHGEHEAAEASLRALTEDTRACSLISPPSTPTW